MQSTSRRSRSHPAPGAASTGFQSTLSQPLAGAYATARHACVVLHDVCPRHWSSCQRVLGQLHAVGERLGIELPLTLLVVPAMHGSHELPADYLRWLHRLARNGHELALHGYTHLDEGPAAQSLRAHATRRWYTAGEGEFAAIDRATADRRLAQGRDWARRHGLAMDGFVAPAWLLSAESWDAVAAAGFAYTCTLNELVALPGRQTLRAPSVVFSTRSAWRRALSVVWTSIVARRLRSEPIFRLELHPGDGDHPTVQRRWVRLLLRAMRDRQAVCLRDAVALRLGGAPKIDSDPL